jgi:outer membrane protein TolC
MTSRLVLSLALGLAGCTTFATKPEIAPDRYAPAAPSEPWTAAARTRDEYVIPPAERAPDRVAEPPASTAQTGVPRYGLPQLIAIALANNPDTRATWERARAAAAAYGASRAPYYPTVTAQTRAGYERTNEELPHESGVLRRWYAEPTLQLTYLLVDFGRRSADDEMFREQLAAANFTFNRALQTVVFQTQRASYTLAAAKAAVVAAEQNLELARTDDEAVDRRVDLGLATQPALLLSRARVAQSKFDLANARLLVRDAQANLALAMGVAANAPFDVDNLETHRVPASFTGKVDELIAEAVRQRPDLAAQVASLQARGAGVDRARAEFYPTVDARAKYGEQIWSFQFAGPPTQNPIEPQYAGQLTLTWDLFTGFKRQNQLRQAEANRAAAAASLRSGELATIAEVWRAYYELESTKEKYTAAEAVVAASQEAHAANIETYRNGLSTIVELLTADRDLANARYAIIQSTADVLTASAAVAYAIGAVEAPKQP